MKLTFISDTHGRHDYIDPQHLKGDILFHTGDFSNRGTITEVTEFFNWFSNQTQYKHRVCIAGNHDLMAEDRPSTFEILVPDNVIYLQDSGIELKGLKIWGTPVTAEFRNRGFNRSSTELDKHFSLIPDDTQVLLTHGGPSGTLQYLENGLDVGMSQLETRIEDLAELKISAFGHIHHSRGTKTKDGIKYINSAVCNEAYRPINKPITIKLK